MVSWFHGFMVSELSYSTLIGIEKLVEKENKFYSLAIGKFNLITNVSYIFEEEWVYNSSSSSVEPRSTT